MFGMTLREVLHAHIPTLSQEATVRDAVDKMDIYQFPALVMVTPELAPTHVVTEGDIVRAVQQQGNLSDLATQAVRPFASQDPTCAHPDAEIGDALHIMLDSGLTILPVVEESRLIGVVLRVDLMQAMIADRLTPSV